MAVKITDLGQATLPLAGTEVLEIVQGGDSRQVSADALASAASGLDATFVTISANAALPNERILTEGSGVSIVDSGAGLAVTISAGPFPTALGILGDINTATPPVAEAITAVLELRDLQDVNIIGSLGFDASNTLDLKNLMRGGELLFSATDSGGSEAFAYFFDPAASFWLRHGATQEIVIFSQSVSAGGVLVANGVTGAGGNSRVRTASDKGALEIEYNFDTSTDTSTDPGSQEFRMNNSNPALVTEIAVADQSIASQSEFDLFWGAELVSGDKLFIVQPNSQDNWAQYLLTGPPVDQGAFWNFPVSLIDNGTIFDSTRLCRFSFNLLSLAAGGGVPGVTDEQTLVAVGTTLTASDFFKHDNSDIITLTGQFADTFTFDMSDGQNMVFGGSGIDGINISDRSLSQGSIGNAAVYTQSYVGTIQSLSSNTAAHILRLGITGTPWDAIEIFQGAKLRFLEVGGLDPIDLVNTGTHLQFDLTDAQILGLKLDGNAVLKMDEIAAAPADEANYGQVWVRDDAPNVLVFTDDTGVDHLIGGGVSASQLLDPSANIAVNAIGSGKVELRSVGNTDAEERLLLGTHQDGTIRYSIGQDFAEAIVIRNHISDNSSANFVVRMGIGPGNQDRINCGGAYVTGSVVLHAGDSGGPDFRVENDAVVGSHVDGGGLFIGEQAAAEADVAGLGQLWVKDDAPNVLFFVDDLGNENKLSTNLAGLGVTFQNFSGTEIMFISSDGTGDIDIDFTNVSVVNFNSGTAYDFSNDLIRSVGSLQLTERADHNATIATQGQLWVRQDSPQSLMFTNDDDTDFVIGGGTDEVGTFTGTLTGCTTSPTATFHYRISDDIVTCWLEDDLTGTSNSTSMSITGLAAAVTPSTFRAGGDICHAIDDNNRVPVETAPLTSNILAFGMPDAAWQSGGSFSTIAFTNTGTKGLRAGFIAQWPLF